MYKKLFAVLLSASIAASLMLGVSANTSVNSEEGESIVLFVIGDDRNSD